MIDFFFSTVLVLQGRECNLQVIYPCGKGSWHGRLTMEKGFAGWELDDGGVVA